MFHNKRDLMAGTKLAWIWYPFHFLFLFLFIYPSYKKVLNLKLNNLKFTFVFFFLLHSNFTIFVPIASIYLMPVDDRICINVTRIMLLT